MSTRANHKFKVGEHVSWDSDVGRVRGKVTKMHTKDFQFIGKMRRASAEEPQYEVKSDKTGHLAAHKESALRKLNT